jgi:hypothetical protein
LYITKIQENILYIAKIQENPVRQVPLDVVMLVFFFCARNPARAPARKGHQGRAYSAVSSQDGCLVLTSSTDHTVKLWKREFGECLRAQGGVVGEFFLFFLFVCGVLAGRRLGAHRLEGQGTETVERGVR